MSSDYLLIIFVFDIFQSACFRKWLHDKKNAIDNSLLFCILKVKTKPDYFSYTYVSVYDYMCMLKRYIFCNLQLSLQEHSMKLKSPSKFAMKAETKQLNEITLPYIFKNGTFKSIFCRYSLKWLLGLSLIEMIHFTYGEYYYTTRMILKNMI